MPAMDAFGVTDATKVINCTELTAAEVGKRLEVYDAP